MKFKPFPRLAKLDLPQVARTLGRDAPGLAGVACIVHGAHQVYGPAGWLTAGAFGLAFSALASRPQKPAA